MRSFRACLIISMHNLCSIGLTRRVLAKELLHFSWTWVSTCVGPSVQSCSFNTNIAFRFLLQTRSSEKYLVCVYLKSGFLCMSNVHMNRSPEQLKKTLSDVTFSNYMRTRTAIYDIEEQDKIS